MAGLGGRLWTVCAEYSVDPADSVIMMTARSHYHEVRVLQGQDGRVGHGQARQRYALVCAKYSVDPADNDVTFTLQL